VVERSESTNVVIFDSRATAAGQHQSLKLHFSLPAAEYELPMAGAPPVVVGNTLQAQPAILLASSGPFEFDFEVPVTRSK
jgi:hypothetical protein